MSTPPVAGYVGWYKGDGWTTSGWTNAANSATNKVTNFTGSITTGYDPTNGQLYVCGSSTTTMTLPFTWATTTSPYTFFHVARYNGSTRGRIFTGETVNWLSGFHGYGDVVAKTGVAHHNGWLTQPTLNQFDQNMWLVSSDRPANYRANGIDKTVSVITGCAPEAIKINKWPGAAEPSDWAVAEMIVYNSTLSEADVLLVENYLMTKHLNAVPLTGTISMVGGVFQKLYGRTTNPQTGISALIRDNGTITTNVTSVPAWGGGSIGLSHAKGKYRNPLLFRYSADTLVKGIAVNAAVTTCYDDLRVFDATSTGTTYLRYDTAYKYYYLDFTGANYLTVPSLTLKYQNAASQGIQGFTCIVVAKFNDAATWARLLDFGNGTTNVANDTFILARAGTTNTLSFHWYNGATLGFNSPVDNVIDLNLHMWTVVVDNVALTVKIYKDGNLISSVVSTALPNKTLNSGKNYIGKSNWSADSLLNGRIASFDWYTQPLLAKELALQHALYMNRYRQALPLMPGLMFRTFGDYFADDPTFFTYNGPKELVTGTSTNLTNVYTGTNSALAVNTDTMSVEWFGYFLATETGTWTFYVATDDASYLWLGSTALSGFLTTNALVNNGGGHGVLEKSATISLTAGTYYAMRLQYGNGGGAGDCQFSFAPPSGTRTYDGTGYYFASTGFNSAFPGLSARSIKACTGTTTDGAYYVLLGGVSTLTYCLMDDKWDGGGWMLGMKAARANTFPFASTYWTDTTTTLNKTDVTRNVGDAKYDVFNSAYGRDILALWPDVGLTGGSISGQTEAWSWKVNDYLTSSSYATGFPVSGYAMTLIDGLSSNNSRNSPDGAVPTSFSGFSASIWSQQAGYKRHLFGGGSQLGANRNVRWGFLFNNEADFGSIDAYGGIGMSSDAGYSGGDYYACCGTAGLNRSMRYELYTR